MRRILILLGFVLGVLSAYAESKSYTINNMFTISVDSKLELRDKKGLYEQKTKNNNLPVTSDEVIVFQQTGLNNDIKAAYQKYARIMIQTEISNEGDYSSIRDHGNKHYKAYRQWSIAYKWRRGKF